MNENDNNVKLPRGRGAHTKMLLAGDVGGTKTLLGLYEGALPAPEPQAVRRFPTLDFGGLAGLVTAFLGSVGWRGPLEAACFGVAGPVRGQTCQLTNVPWRVDAGRVGAELAIPRVALLNDLASLAHAVPTLTGDQLAVIRPGDPEADGNAALIAPGTGLGEALLHNVGGRFAPAPSEAGHADFAARTGREAELARALTARFGRTSYEHVISGPGLVNIHRFVHGDAGCGAVPPETAAADQPALISRAGLARSCAGCAETLELFVGALGAEAGNLGLRSVATAGVYLGGGIPPRILPALRTPTFVDAFRSKAPMAALVDAMPIAVILEPHGALLGAAIAAQRLAQEAPA